MTKIECKYLAKLEIINSLLDLLDNESDIEIDDLKSKLIRSQLFYRNCLQELQY